MEGVVFSLLREGMEVAADEGLVEVVVTLRSMEGVVFFAQRVINRTEFS